MLKSIKSNRLYENWPSWQIVHEWEDIISEELNVPIFSKDLKLMTFHKLFFKFQFNKRLLNFFLYSNTKEEKSLVFHLSPLISKFKVPSTDIPIIIDFWKNVDIDKFSEAYQNCHLVIVTSKEVFNYLKDRTSLPIAYLPLSLPDRYYLGSYTRSSNLQLIKDKDIDLIQPGRSNIIFDEWIKKYLQEHPETHYVYNKVVDGQFLYYSNQLGLLEYGDSREDYFNLLKRSKVTIYSSPGIDNGGNRTGGFNPLTPKFLEFISQFCFVVCRYADNEEFEPIKSFSPNLKDYSSFETLVTNHLKNIVNADYFKASNTFLKDRTTNKIIKSIPKLFETLDDYADL